MTANGAFAKLRTVVILGFLFVLYIAIANKYVIIPNYKIFHGINYYRNEANLEIVTNSTSVEFIENKSAGSTPSAIVKVEEKNKSALLAPTEIVNISKPWWDDSELIECSKFLEYAENDTRRSNTSWFEYNTNERTLWTQSKFEGWQSTGYFLHGVR